MDAKTAETAMKKILVGLAVVACARPPEEQTGASVDQGAQAAPAVQRKEQAGIDWSPTRLEAGDAWIDCGADYASGDGRAR